MSTVCLFDCRIRRVDVSTAHGKFQSLGYREMAKSVAVQPTAPESVRVDFQRIPVVIRSMPMPRRDPSVPVYSRLGRRTSSSPGRDPRRLALFIASSRVAPIGPPPSRRRLRIAQSLEPLPVHPFSDAALDEDCRGRASNARSSRRHTGPLPNGAASSAVSCTESPKHPLDSVAHPAGDTGTSGTIEPSRGAMATRVTGPTAVSSARRR